MNTWWNWLCFFWSKKELLNSWLWPQIKSILQSGTELPVQLARSFFVYIQLIPPLTHALLISLQSSTLETINLLTFTTKSPSSISWTLFSRFFCLLRKRVCCNIKCLCIQLLLGLPIPALQDSSCVCLCGQNHDFHGYHRLNCKQNAGWANRAAQ